MTDTSFSIDISAARSFQRRKLLQRSSELRELHFKAVQDFSRIVLMIIEDYNPKRIYQWGSLLHPEHFSEVSDIDIALEGLKGAEVFFDLCNQASELTAFPVDIIELERINPLQRKSIIKNGKLIYERD